MAPGVDRLSGPLPQVEGLLPVSGALSVPHGASPPSLPSSSWVRLSEAWASTLGKGVLALMTQLVSHLTFSNSSFPPQPGRVVTLLEDREVSAGVKRVTLRPSVEGQRQAELIGPPLQARFGASGRAETWSCSVLL